MKTALSLHKPCQHGAPLNAERFAKAATPGAPRAAPRVGPSASPAYQPPTGFRPAPGSRVIRWRDSTSKVQASRISHVLSVRQCRSGHGRATASPLGDLFSAYGDFYLMGLRSGLSARAEPYSSRAAPSTRRAVLCRSGASRTWDRPCWGCAAACSAADWRTASAMGCCWRTASTGTLPCAAARGRRPAVQ